MKTNQGLPKSQRIYKNKDISTLFEKGKGFSIYPFRVVVHKRKSETPDEALPRLLVSVSKKRFHHAIKRNKVKRLVRETWRKNKDKLMSLCDNKGVTLDVAIVYTATCILEYNEIEQKIKKVVERLVGNNFK
ncbi:MAG: ribonuclease P protein component [Candidatus Limimorpha sp.]